MLELNLYTLLVGGIVFFLAVYLLKKGKPGGNMPPGPKGWPLYGNILAMKKWDVNGPGIVDKWGREFGDIFSIQLGSYPTVVLNSLDTVKEAFLKNADKTSGRHGNVFFFRHVIKRANTGVAFNDGQSWKELRRTMLHSLRDFGMGKKSLEHRIQEEARALITYLDDIGDKPFDPRQILHNVFSNVIVSIIFGDRYEYDDPEFTHLSYLLSELFKGSGFKNPEIFVPVLTPIMPLTNWHLFTLVKNSNEMNRLIKKTIQNHREQFNPDDIRSFVDIYLKAEMDGEITDSKSEQNLFYTILDLFFAGSETSTTTTRWAMLYLIHNPDVQAKCQQVIKEEIGQERMPTGADRANLVYVDATIHEIQRMANITPYGVIHRVEETVELSGYTIPTDTLLIPNVTRLHMDPIYWKDPERFNPDRWIGKYGKLLKHEAFMPFSVGPRECPGKGLALQEMFIILVSLLQKFTFKAKDPDNLPKLSGNIGLVNVPGDFEIIIARC